MYVFFPLSAQFKAITLGNAVHMVDTPKLKEHTDASSADEMALGAIEDDDDDTMGANELQPAPKEVMFKKPKSGIKATSKPNFLVIGTNHRGH